MSVLPDGFAVEINLAGPESSALIWDDPTRGLWDTGVWGGSTDLVDMVALGLVRGGSISRGSTRFEGVYARAEAGTAEVVLDNRDARFDPTNLAGPYVALGVTQVVPMRAFRVRAGAYDLWRGFADAWRLGYPPGDAVCTLVGTDGFKVLANFNGLEQGSQGAGEDTGARVARILDNADWPAADRDLDAGLTAVQATTLASPALAEILLTADTEVGEFYISGAGKAVYRNREALFTEARSTTSQATFAGSGLAGVDLQSLEVSYDDLQLANLVKIGRAGGVVQSAADTDSQQNYLLRTFERSDLLHQTDAESLAFAEYALSILKDPELRVEAITLVPPDDPTERTAFYAAVLARELGDRITVTATLPGRPGDPLVRDAWVRGIVHEFGPERWVTRFVLQDTTAFGFGVVGTAVVGVSKVSY